MRRAATTLAAGVLAVSGIAAAGGAAQATTRARIQGTHLTTVKTTYHKNFPADAGKVYKGRKYTFAPKCATGPCDTVLKRQRNTSNTFVTTTLNLNADGTYSGTTHYVSACYDRNGNVLDPQAYNTTEITTITPTAISGGLVTHYKGTLATTFQPKSTAPAKCTADRITSTLTS